MKKCPICGCDVVSKRKDAKYCKDSACRKKAHQERREQAEKVPPQLAGNKAAVVVSFPDGSRWLMELTPLQSADAAKLPSLKQVDIATPEISSGSAPMLAPAPPTMSVSSQPSSAQAEISSEQILPAETATLLASPLPQESTSAGASSQESLTSRPPEVTPLAGASALGPALPPAELRTIELFFIDDRGCRLPFHDAIQNTGGDGWRVRRHARAMLGFSRSDGHGLAGTPGRWHDFYPGKSPLGFGLDGDLGVLYGDGGRVYVVDPALLREVLGAGWRVRLRELADGRMAGSRRW